MRNLLTLVVMLTLLAVVSAQAQDDDDIVFEDRTLSVDGMERRYLLYVPPQAANGDSLPLVFLLHGGGGRPEIYEEVTGFGQIARDEGVLLVYPAGTGARSRSELLTWNAGHCCAAALANDVDDVAFFRAMVGELTAEFNVDADRIFVTGHSNGAMMTYRLLAEMSDVFAAGAAVAGSVGGYPTPDSDDLFVISQPENAVSVLAIHGMLDGSVRFEGGVNDDDTPSHRNDLSVAESIAFWVDVNACDPEPERTSQDDDMVLIDSYTCDMTDTVVELIAIVDGGHSWPGGEGGRLRSDPPSQRVNASEAIWAFFAANPRGGE